MSNNQKQFGAGMIVSAIFIPMFLGMMYWIGEQASQVPALKKELRLDIVHLNNSIKTLTSVAKESNIQLASYTKYHAKNLAKITEAIVIQKYKLNEVEKKCIENKLSIKEFQKRNYK